MKFQNKMVDPKKSVSSVDLKPVAGYKNYFVSNTGKVFTKNSGKMEEMKVRINSKGYLGLTLCQNNVKKTFTVHRLVATAWLPNPLNLPAPDHIDRNKLNNNVSNLEWVTQKENNRRAREGPDFKAYKKAVVQTTLDGTFISRFDSIAEATKQTGFDGSGITKVLKKTRTKFCNFCWFYESEYKSGDKRRKKANPTKKVNQYSMKGKFIKSFNSVKDAAASVGAMRANVSNACAGRSKSCRNYIWKYAKPEKKERKIDETADWVVLSQYPLYKISRDGRVYTTHLKRMKIQTEPVNEKDYYSINVVDIDGNHSKMYIHIFVAMAYILNPEELPVVNHIDGDQTNNTVENLEWVTSRDNAKHAHDTGLGSSKKITIQMNLEGKEIGRYDSLKTASRFTGISTHRISKVCRGEIKSDQTGGYKWKYLDV